MRGLLPLPLLLALALAAASPSRADGQRRPSRRAASEARAASIRAELAGVLLQSRRYKEAAREYRTLLELDPANSRYRLGLARALAWGDRPREAERELLLLQAERPGDLAVDSLLVAARLAMEPSSREAAGWMAQRPGYSPYRRAFARALARERRLDEALAQYDTLIDERRAPDLLVERAYVHLQRREYPEVETDVSASIASGPTPEAYVLLGDLRRWRGDYGGAAAAYEQARALRPGDRIVAAAFARLARDQRPAIAYLPDLDDPAGWETTTTSAGDNLGVQYSTLALRRGVGGYRGFDASVGGELRWLSEHGVSPESGPSAYGADVALSREVTFGPLYARGRLRGGAWLQPAGETVPEGALALAAWYDAWSAGLELSSAPAYPSLLTMASFVPTPGDGGQLRERTVRASLAGPVERADVALSAETSRLSDGNLRANAQGLLRFPVSEHVAAVAAGSVLSYSLPSPAYWDPERYVTQAAGLEYALRRVRGLSFVARALPGLAWSRERFTAQGRGPTGQTAVAFQLSGGAEAAYRSDRWEVASGLTYGRGRAGSYQRLDGVLQLRYLP